MSQKAKRIPDAREKLMIKNRIANIKEQIHVVGMYLQEIERWNGPNVDPSRLAVYGVLNEVEKMSNELMAKPATSNQKGGQQ